MHVLYCLVGTPSTNAKVYIHIHAAAIFHADNLRLLYQSQVERSGLMHTRGEALGMRYINPKWPTTSYLIKSFQQREVHQFEVCAMHASDQVAFGQVLPKGTGQSILSNL